MPFSNDQKVVREQLWFPKKDFRGDPNSEVLGWWWDESGRETYVELDEIMLDSNGAVCGKRGGGADYYTHVMVADFDRPAPPSMPGAQFSPPHH